MPHSLRQPLSRLIYTSRLTELRDSEDVRKKVGSIAAAAAERNREQGVTGSLTFVDGTFVQLLEGPHEAVEGTFERICRDFRHEDIKLIDLTDTTERIFEDWGMAYLSDDAMSQGPSKGDLQEIRYLLGVNVREAVNLMNRQVRQTSPKT